MKYLAKVIVNKVAFCAKARILSSSLVIPAKVIKLPLGILEYYNQNDRKHLWIQGGRDRDRIPLPGSTC